ncbi:hypothetical protein RN001_015142 [Aquatica leii]|uniref:Uncharacterized protein n=1 Tax=Aquatica leii TaxID=1421715 RepID=A0AAN7P1E6_9COLE|nr:hypothetical protein RN001_015142 [Aquatica leii]
MEDSLCTEILILLFLLVILRFFYLTHKVTTGNSSIAAARRNVPAKTLICIGSGGHTTEILELVKQLDFIKYSPRYYILAKSDTTSVSKIKDIELNNVNYDIVTIPRSRVVGQSYITSVATTLYSILCSIPCVVRIRPDLVLCNGPGTCIPICLIAFILKALFLCDTRIVFVESFCRTKTFSLSAEVIYNNGIITTPNPKYEPDSRGAGYVFFYYLKKHSDKILQMDGYTGEEDTFGSVLQRSIRIALQMQCFGPVLASLFVGAKIACFDERMHLNEAAVLMNQIKPKILFVSLTALEFIETLLESLNKTAFIIVFGATDTHQWYHWFAQGICLSHRAYLGEISVVLDLEKPSERFLIFSTLFWSSYAVYWEVAIIKGYTKIIINFLEDLEPIWNAIANYHPTFMFIHPFSMKKLYNAKIAHANVDSIRRICIVGGATLEHELFKYRQMFPKAIVTPAYGLTEAGPSTGRALNGISYKIVDVDTEEVLGPYEKGELRIKTKNVFTKYYKIDSTDAFDSDGWFKTGDLMYYDEDFYFYYVERLKELIKYQVWHVPPKMIEDILELRDDVSAACVIGIPHDVDREHPMAIIELKNTCTNIVGIEENISQYVEQALGDNFKLRGGVNIVDKIPLTPSGKFDVRKSKNTAAEINETIDVHDLSSRLGIDVIASCAFGIEADSLNNPNSQVKKNATEYFRSSIRNTILLLIGMINPRILSFFRINFVSKKVTNFFINLMEETVDYREANNVIRKDFIHLLLQIKNNANIIDDAVGSFEKTDLAPQLTIKEMAAQSLVFFVGGFETVSITILYCLYELAKNPTIQDKARAEIQKCLLENSENDKLSYALLQNLHYVDKVIHETLRLYPPVSIISRECTKNYTIPDSDVTIEKGCAVIISTLGIHRDPEFYPNPDEFDPERFSPEDMKKRPPCTWIPFSAGPRNCIAYQFGTMEAKTVIATLLNRYRFTITPESEQPFTYSASTLLLLPSNKIQLNVEKL